MAEKYGQWTVIGEAEKRGKFRYLRCQCSCGIERDVSFYSLRNGASKGCGIKRNHHKELIDAKPERNAWRNMIDRCRNPKNKSYPNYGARGIAVCQRWEDFSNFLSDMGRRPSDKHSLDRIDTNGSYEPGNCRWATIKEQNRNLRTCRPVKRSDGEIFGSIAEAAESVGVDESVVRQALKRGWRTSGYSWEHVKTHNRQETGGPSDAVAS